MCPANGGNICRAWAVLHARLVLFCVLMVHRPLALAELHLIGCLLLTSEREQQKDLLDEHPNNLTSYSSDFHGAVQEVQ